MTAVVKNLITIIYLKKDKFGEIFAIIRKKLLQIKNKEILKTIISKITKFGNSENFEEVLKKFQNFAESFKKQTKEESSPKEI